MTALAIRSFTRKLTVLTYFAVVLVPVLLLGYDGPWFGPGDISIRGRAPFPEKFAPGAFGGFDLWFADRVGLRFPLIYAGTSFHVGALHRPLDRHIVFGREGWMYWTDDGDTAPAAMADSRGKLRFTAAEVRRIDASLRTIHDRFAACGIPSAVFIAPNKQSIYGEFLINTDAGLPTTRLDALIDELGGEARDMIIDARPIMRTAKRERAPLRLYNKTETHWNDLGAYYGYVAVVSKLARLMPIANPERIALDNYRMTVESYAGGDMATRVLFSPWRFPDENIWLTPKEPIAGPGQVQVEEGHFVYRNPRGSGRLVLFGDSYATQLVPFLAQHFEEVHRYAADAIDGGLAARHRPDAVLFETLESYAPRLLLPPIGLERACAE
jgi:alginate O-acetyltransferase complex protein AlgJ